LTRIAADDRRLWDPRCAPGTVSRHRAGHLLSITASGQHRFQPARPRRLALADVLADGQAPQSGNCPTRGVVAASG
jgi:hypothetical protein